MYICIYIYIYIYIYVLHSRVHSHVFCSFASVYDICICISICVYSFTGIWPMHCPWALTTKADYREPCARSEMVLVAENAAPHARARGLVVYAKRRHGPRGRVSMGGLDCT